MPIQFDNYTPNKIENLKNHLVAMAAKGNAKFYEIFVDALKAVPKTDEPNQFDSYEEYMTPDTEQLRILIYNSNLSPRNDQYVFVLKARTRDEANNTGLQGFPVKTFSKNSLSGWRDRQVHQSMEAKDFEIAQLKKEISELKKEVSEAEEEYESLQEELNEANAQLEIARKNGNKIGGIHFGDIASVALEGLIRRNTKFIAKIPGASELAGLIEKDNQRDPNENSQQEDTEVSFKKKTESTETKKETATEPTLTEKEKFFIGLMKELEKHFSEEEMAHVITILNYFSKNKDFLLEVLEEIQGENEEEK
jgi:hypothetical protein